MGKIPASCNNEDLSSHPVNPHQARLITASIWNPNTPYRNKKGGNGKYLESHGLDTYSGKQKSVLNKVDGRDLLQGCSLISMLYFMTTFTYTGKENEKYTHIIIDNIGKAM